jgi:hypothetical protein
MFEAACGVKVILMKCQRGFATLKLMLGIALMMYALSTVFAYVASSGQDWAEQVRYDMAQKYVASGADQGVR